MGQADPNRIWKGIELARLAQPNSRFCRYGAAAIAVWLFVGGLDASDAIAEEPVAQLSATVDFTPRPVSLIPAGTMFDESPPERWSHVISFVRSQLTAGDVDAVTDTVRYYAEIFNLVMLADTDIDADDQFVLRQVAVGFSTRIGDKNVIVTPDTQAKLGGELSLIGRSVLAGNIDALGKVRQIARTPHNMIMDAPATMLLNDEHRQMIVRYYIWVFPANGNVGTLVWLLDPIGDRLSIVDDVVQLLPPNMHEDRIMNVDGEKFNFLGIPSNDALALVQIPQGTPFEMKAKMRTLASLKTYDAETMAELTAAIAKTLQPDK